MTEIVGIVNVTPDSFSDGGQFADVRQAAERVEQLFQDGADMVDIGAESTRPGAVEVKVEEEWARLESVISKLQERYAADRFSIDTRHAEIAKRAVRFWSPDLMINDVTGMSDSAMSEIVADHGLRIVISHLPKRAGGDIAKAHKEKITSEEQVRDELLEIFNRAQAAGIAAEKIVLDPGIGFGKSPELNRRLLGFAALLSDIPVMIGYSRKRFLGEDRMKPEPNLEAGRIAVATGARYLRVHDVAGHQHMV